MIEVRHGLGRCHAKGLEQSKMKNHGEVNTEIAEWFAIRTRQVFDAEQRLEPLCNEVFLPKQQVVGCDRRKRLRAVIPRVLFVRTTLSSLLEMERLGHEVPEANLRFWIYRYPKENRVRPIADKSISLLRLITAPDQTRCEIFRKTDFRVDQPVRVTGGEFEGYEGYVHRVHKNRHVVVKIEGLCMVMLPFIHPDLLQPLE